MAEDKEIQPKKFWTRMVSILSGFVPGFIKDYVAPYILKMAGVSGGIWTWIVAQAVKLGWKKVEKEISQEARLADQTATDEALNEKYQEDIKNAAPEEFLIKDELDLLNGGRRP